MAPARNCAGAGVLTSHKDMTATLLAARPEHNAATPTFWRQGSLITATALPRMVEVFYDPES